MKNLELKDICSYLPYGLKCASKQWKEPMQIVGVQKRLVYIECLVDDISNIKPYLYSMDWITKEITHKGETFVPIVELAKINEPEYTSIEINDKGRVSINTPYVENMTMVYDSINAIFLNLTIRKDGSYRLETSRAARKQQPLFDKLSEWHFDFRGLIDAGLALPVTNEFNPYKL